MIKNILLVDNDPNDLRLLKELLGTTAPSAKVKVANSAAGVKKALEEENEIDVLFLDFELPGVEKLASSDTFNSGNFELVATANDSKYAFKAIKNGAVDFLVKPVAKGELEETLEKINEKLLLNLGPDDAMPQEEQERYLQNKLWLNHQQGIKLILLKDIVYLEAENSYTSIFLVNGQKITTSKPISRFMQSFDERVFFRIHKSYIINLYHFTEYISKDGDVAVMTNGDKLYISRYRLPRFLDLLKKSAGKLKI